MNTQKDWRARPDGHGGFYWWHRKYPQHKMYLSEREVDSWGRNMRKKYMMLILRTKLNGRTVR